MLLPKPLDSTENFIYPREKDQLNWAMFTDFTTTLSWKKFRRRYRSFVFAELSSLGGALIRVESG